MFQTERILWRPLGSPVIVWVTVDGGGELLPLTVWCSLPSTKYSQSVVRCSAVNFQVKFAVLLICWTTHGMLSLSRTVKRLPPLQFSDPFGASTLCGSYWMSPQLATVCV